MGLLLVAVVLGFQALTVRDSLQQVAADLSRMGFALADGDTPAARARLGEADDAAGRARFHTRGPLWWAAEHLPVVGDDVEAVRTVADVSAGLTGDTLPPVVGLGDVVAPAALRPVDGRVDLGPLEAAAPIVAEAAVDLAQARDRIGGLRTSGLVDPLRGPVVELRDRLQQAARLGSAAATATELMPPMLGRDGERRYLLVTQNTAEARATGGIPGSAALVTADNGRLRMGQLRAASSFGQFEEPVVRLTTAERRLWGPGLAVYMQDATFTPDFPRSARIIQRMWEEREGGRVDGVLSVDPVALSYVMRGAGSISAPSGRELTAQNVVSFLLSTVYRENPDPVAQDLVFAAVGRAVFDDLVGGAGTAREVLRGVAQGADERRVLLWSARPEEQERLDATVVGGALGAGDPESPEVGVFLNDNGADKMTYYLRHTVDVLPSVCHGDGSQEATVRVRLRSDAPPGGGDLPEYVVGDGTYGFEPGDLRVTVYVYSPVGGGVLDGTADGEDAPLFRAPHQGHEVAALTLDVEPGQTRELLYTVRSGAGQSGEVRLRTTPGTHSTGVGVVGPSACG